MAKTNNTIKKWGKNFRRLPFKENTQMANKYVKRYSTSVIIKKMQISYHIPPGRNGYYKKVRDE